MKNVGSLLIIVCLAGYPCAQMPVPDQVKKVVTFIYPLDKDGKPVFIMSGKPAPYGTGFLVGIKNPTTPDRYSAYIVTAKHVLRTPDNSRYWAAIDLRFDLKKGGVDDIKVVLAPDGNAKNVFTSTDPSVDLAIILAPEALSEEKHEFVFLQDYLITGKDDFASLGIREGSQVFFTGLFLAHTGEKRNYPIVRFGRVALVTDEKVNWNGTMSDLYLIEATSYGGNSGAPVFFYLGAEREPGKLVLGEPVLKLAGIMQGYFNELGPVKLLQNQQARLSQSTQQSPPVPIVELNSGIAAVVPAYKLKELLFSDEVRKTRIK